MFSMVTAIIAAERNWTIIDYNAGEASHVVIKVFTYVKIAWDRVGKHVCDGAYDHYNYMETSLKNPRFTVCLLEFGRVLSQ